MVVEAKMECDRVHCHPWRSPRKAATAGRNGHHVFSNSEAVLLRSLLINPTLRLTEIEDELVIAPSVTKLRPAIFTEDERARAALLIPVPRLIRRAPLALSNGGGPQVDEELVSILGKRPWPLFGRVEEKAVDGLSSSDEEEEEENEQEQDRAPAKKRARLTVPKPNAPPKDQVKTRTHQEAFLASLQPTPAVLHQNAGETKKRFDDDGRLAWLQKEQYIKADSIERYSVVCGCCLEAQVTKVKKGKGRKAGKEGKQGKNNGFYSPSVWITHRKICPRIYQTWMREGGLVDETWSFRG